MAPRGACGASCLLRRRPAGLHRGAHGQLPVLAGACPSTVGGTSRPPWRADPVWALFPPSGRGGFLAPGVDGCAQSPVAHLHRVWAGHASPDPWSAAESRVIDQGWRVEDVQHRPVCTSSPPARCPPPPPVRGIPPLLTGPAPPRCATGCALVGAAIPRRGRRLPARISTGFMRKRTRSHFYRCRTHQKE